MKPEIRLIECAQKIVFSKDGKTMHHDHLGKIRTTEVATGKLIHEFPYHGTSPRIGGMSPDDKLIYSTDFFGNHVMISDTENQTQTRGYETGWDAGGLAVTADGKQLYIIAGGPGKTVVSVVDSESQTFIKKIWVSNLDIAIKINPANSRFYVLSALKGNEGVNVIEPQTGKVTLTPMEIAIGSDIVFDPSKRLAYISNWEQKSITVVNTMNDGTRATHSVEGTPHEMALSTDGSLLYALNNYGSKLIDVYQTDTMALVEQVEVEQDDLRVIATSKTGVVFVGYYVQAPLSKT
jgi:DNA-binding beta-propeller fold protein YncE